MKRRRRARPNPLGMGRNEEILTTVGVLAGVAALVYYLTRPAPAPAPAPNQSLIGLLK
jgi:hypothetical protein